MNLYAKIAIGIGSIIGIIMAAKANTPAPQPIIEPVPQPKRVVPVKITPPVLPQGPVVGSSVYFNTVADKTSFGIYKSVADYLAGKPYFSYPTGKKNRVALKYLGVSSAKRNGVNIPLTLVRLPGSNNDAFIESFLVSNKTV